jgi:hypothetical protein
VTTPNPKKPMPTKVQRDPQPYTGATAVDLSPVASILVDLPKGAMKGLRRQGAGIADVVAELAAAMPTYGAAAGVAPALYTSFTTHTGNIAKLQAVGTLAQKLAEVVTESIALEEDAQAQNLGQIGDAIRSTAKRTKNNSILAPFQKTLAYQSEAGVKAAATRAKKKAAKATTTGTAAGTPGTAGTTAAAGTSAGTAAGH